MLCLTKHFIIEVSSLPKHTHLQDRLWEKVIPIADGLMKSDSTSVAGWEGAENRRCPDRDGSHTSNVARLRGWLCPSGLIAVALRRERSWRTFTSLPACHGDYLGWANAARKCWCSHPHIPRKEASQFFPDTFHFSHKLFQASFLLCACKALQYFMCVLWTRVALRSLRKKGRKTKQRDAQDSMHSTSVPPAFCCRLAFFLMLYLTSS